MEYEEMEHEEEEREEEEREEEEREEEEREEEEREEEERKGMERRDMVIKHLEIIQTIINRLGNNSFLVKGWSMTLIIASLALMSEVGMESPLIILSLLIPVFAFWVLDGYFLWKERSFRQIYDEVRIKEDTDFKMKLEGELECNWLSSSLSETLSIFYMAETLFIILSFIFYSCCTN